MIIDVIYYNRDVININNWIQYDKIQCNMIQCDDLSCPIMNICYAINIMDYKIINDRMEIDDKFLMEGRVKLIMDELYKYNWAKRYTIEEILSIKTYYEFYFGNGYYWNSKYVSREKLSINEFVIKKLLE